MARNFRRVVTGHDDQGRSIVWKDGPSPQVVEPLPRVRLHEMWEAEGPADNTGEADTAVRGMSIEPRHPAGTMFRVVELPPDSVWQGMDSAAAFAEMGSGAALDPAHADSMMHETQTVDYAIVMEGEIWAVMEAGETKLEAGDVLVQRGTNHAWSNRSEADAVIAFVLCGAKPRK